MKLKGKELLLFTQEMSSLLNSNMRVQDILTLLVRTSDNKRIKEVTEVLLKDVVGGRMFYQALSKTGCFSEFYIMLVKTGEESANLSSVFLRLCEYLKSKEERKGKTFQALLYPSFVFVAVIAVLLILSFFVFPRLSEVFEVLSSQDSTNTDNFNSMVNHIKTLTVGISTALFILTVFIVFTFKNRKLQYLRDKVAYYIPVVKNLVRNRNTALFCFSMKTLLSSAVHIQDALFLTEQAQNNLYLRAKLKEAELKVQSGRSLSECLLDKTVFPSYFSSFIRVGESTGELCKTFSEMESYYKSKDDRTTEIFIRSLEPVLIILTGLLVFALIWHFIVPLYSMLGEI